MYRWFVFLHVLGVFGFLLAHGTSAAVSFALRRERQLERVQALLLLSGNTLGLSFLSLLVLLVSGIVAGFMGQWWGQGWIWVSLGLLIAIIVAMSVLGSAVYGGVRKAAGLPYVVSGKPQPAVAPADPAELAALLARGQPLLLTIIGYGGFAVITWLMMLKPF